jgi:hypothetical protein
VFLIQRFPVREECNTVETIVVFVVSHANKTLEVVPFACDVIFASAPIDLSQLVDESLDDPGVFSLLSVGRAASSITAATSFGLET